MAAVVIPNCVEVRLKWTGSSIPFLNVLHAQYTIAGPLNPSIGETLFAAIKAAAATTTWLTFLAPDTSFTGVGVRDIRAANNPELVSTGASVPGTNAQAALPHQVAMCVTLKTAFAGKQFRGRVYMGGLAQGAGTTGGVIQGAGNTAAVGFVNAVSTALSAQSMTLAIGQKALPQRNDSHGNVLPARVANVVPVTNIVALNTRFDTQRRRLQ